MEESIEIVEDKSFISKLLKYVKRMYPYVIIAALASSYMIFNVKKGSKNYLVTRETVDSKGNDRTYSEYDNSYTLKSGTITHISSWKLNENNEYERTTKVYDIDKLKPEIAQNIVSNEKTFNSLEEMFGEPISSEKEIGKYLTEEELNRPDYLEAVTYSKDYDKYVVTKLSTFEKVETALISFTYFVMGTLIFGGIHIAKEQNYTKNTEEIAEDSEKKKIKKL